MAQLGNMRLLHSPLNKAIYIYRTDSGIGMHLGNLVVKSHPVLIKITLYRKASQLFADLNHMFHHC